MCSGWLAVTLPSQWGKPHQSLSETVVLIHSLGLSVESLREGFAWYLNTSGMYLQWAPQDLRRVRERMSSAPLALVKVGNHPQEEGSMCLLDLWA